MKPIKKRSSIIDLGSLLWSLIKKTLCLAPLQRAPSPRGASPTRPWFPPKTQWGCRARLSNFFNPKSFLFLPRNNPTSRSICAELSKNERAETQGLCGSGSIVKLGLNKKRKLRLQKRTCIRKITRLRFAKIFNFEVFVNSEIFVVLLMASMSYVKNLITMIFTRPRFVSLSRPEIFAPMVIVVNIFINFHIRRKK